jgi:hypothetical protein
VKCAWRQSLLLGLRRVWTASGAWDVGNGMVKVRSDAVGSQSIIH